MERIRRLINSLLVLVVLGGGIGLTAWLLRTRPTPPKASTAVRVPAVAVAEVVPRVFDAPVVGYGTVRPKNQVKVIPQVSGMITDTHPDLAVGNVIPAGESLFEIDRRAYESQVLQVQADIRLLEAQLERHERQKQNLLIRLENARKLLELAESDHRREQGLVTEGAGRQVEADAALERVLQRRDVVIELENQLALLPHLKAETHSRLEARRAQLEDAERNLENTTIRCPFTARIDQVSAKTSQVVISNLAIAVLTDMEAFELAAVLDPSDLQWADHRAYARAMGEDLGEPPAVTVVWTLHGRRFSWTGAVSRLERHDEATRTARLVVEIPNSLEELTTTDDVQQQPRLSIGMFCAAQIPAEPLREALVLPRSAIHEQNVVYVFEPDPATRPQEGVGRLGFRVVPILRVVEDEVLVEYAGREQEDRALAMAAAAPCTLRSGEFIIVSPMPDPVEGMKLRRRDLLAAREDAAGALLARAARAEALTRPLHGFGARSVGLLSGPDLRSAIAGGD